MQCKNYSSGHPFMRDLNEEMQNGWSPFYEDTRMNGQYRNGFTPRNDNGYSDNGAEMLKQTMLQHEAIFRKQVHELHRVYKLQRELMNELKRDDHCDYSLQGQTSNSTPTTANIPSKFISRLSQPPCSEAANCNSNSVNIRPKTANTPYMLDTSSSCSRLSDSPLCNGKRPFELTSTSKNASPLWMEDGSVSHKGKEQQAFEHGRCDRVMIDLECPSDAHVYDNAGAGSLEQNVVMPFLNSEKPSSCNFESGKGVKLTLETGKDTSSVEEKKDLQSENDSGFHMVDLNEPVREEPPISSSGYHNLTILHRETQGDQSSWKFNSISQSPLKGFFHDNHRDVGAHSNMINMDKEENRRAWPFLNNDANARTSLNPLHPSSSSKNIDAEQFKTEKPHEFPLPFWDKKQSWYRVSAICSNQESAKYAHPASTSYSGPTPPPIPSNMAVFSVPSWRNPSNAMNHVPTAMQPFPCFNSSAPMDTKSRNSGSSIQSSISASDGWKNNGHAFRSSLEGHTPLNPNGPVDDFQRDYSVPISQFPAISFDKPNLNQIDKSAYGHFDGYGKQVKSAEDPQLNIVPRNGFHSTFVLGKDTLFGEGQGRNGTQSGGLSWLKSTPQFHEAAKNLRNGTVQLDKGPMKDHSQISAFDLKPQEFDMSKADNRLFHGDSQTRTQTSEAPSNGKKILGVTIFDQGTSFVKNSTSLLYHPVVNVPNVATESTSCRVNLFDLEKPLAEELALEHEASNVFPSSSNQIDLNCVATSALDVPSSVSVQNVEKACTTGIDLEVPFVPDDENHMLQLEGTFGANQLTESVDKQSNVAKDQEKTEMADEAIVRTSAEIFVAMSVEACKTPAVVPNRPLDTTSTDSLRWFADVVTSKSDDLEGSLAELRGDRDDNGNSDLDDGMDYFESMTLKLKETKFEHNHVKAREEDNENNEKGLVSLLLTKGRKGQGKKRRQRRDFQKDILPGLSSLSRHEVTEDLQMLGGLMRASGQSWQAGSTRRNACRNGGNYQTRGRQRRTRVASSVSVEIPADPPPVHNTIDLETDAGSIMGWGRTRRCRRQRCPSGNVTAPLS